jgi:membrane protein DedA with SNARE-associated domain
MTIIYTPAITYPTILIDVFARLSCPPIPAVLFLIAAGALANYFPRTTSEQPVLNRSFPCVSSSL